jgi:tetratricopeptide (TPR) repeat protein
MKRTEPRLDKNGFPIPPDFDAAGVERPDQRRDDGFPKTIDGPDGGRKSYGLLKLLVVVGVLAALWFHFDLGKMTRNVAAQYHGQQAANLVHRKELDGALSQVEQALAWNPASPELQLKLLLLRADIQFRKQNYAASLADLDQVLAIKPNDADAQRFRVGLLHRTQRHREAAAAATEMLERKIGNREENLNTRAYARAVGDFELEEALVDVDEALRERPENASWVDTRGYVLYRLGRNQEALEELERAIALTEKERQELEDRGRKAVGEVKAGFDQRHAQIDESLAVMYYHRGEVHEKLGHADLAKKDKFIGVKLGYAPESGVY